MSYTVRPLSEDDREQSWKLSLLSFGGDPAAQLPDAVPAGLFVGAFDEAGRLVGRAMDRPYEQWWGGLPVPMSGIAGCASAGVGPAVCRRRPGKAGPQRAR